MNEQLCENLMTQHEELAQYTYPLIVRHGNKDIDVMSIMDMPYCMDIDVMSRRDKIFKPKDAPDQPKEYPDGTLYCFGPEFIGPNAFDPLFKKIHDSALDCSLYIQKRDQQCFGGWYFEIRCLCYKVKIQDMSEYKEGHFQKPGTKYATVKQQRTVNEKSVIDRMSSTNLKKGCRNNGAAKKRSDGRGKKRKASELNMPEKYHSRSKYARSIQTRCDHTVRLLLSGKDGMYYLRSDTDLKHRFHTPEPPESNQLNESDLNPQQKSWVEEMYKAGVSNGTIARTMTGLFTKEGKAGEFKTDNIKYITQKWAKEIEAVKGISQKFSVAEKTIARLNR
jgi:hypothetical protein